MWSLFPAMFLVSVLDPAPTAASQADHWLNCSTIQSAQHGLLAVDNIAYVFFDTGSWLIDAQGTDSLDRFISGYRAPPNCVVLIEGHSDRTGSAHYNLLLSRRRADAVAAYLRRKGIKAALSINSHGETRPQIETADGVAEPQNRYVVLVVDDPPSAEH